MLIDTVHDTSEKGLRLMGLMWSAGRDLESRSRSLEAELNAALLEGGEGVLARARGFARFEVIAAEHCRAAAAVLDSISAAGRGVSAPDTAALERLVELGQLIQTCSSRGLLLLRDAVAAAAAPAVDGTTVVLQRSLEVLVDSRADAPPAAEGSDTTRPMAPAWALR
jgi:hypothetical protein